MSAASLPRVTDPPACGWERLELRPASHTVACLRPCRCADVRFLSNGRDRWCPLRSPVADLACLCTRAPVGATMLTP
jgi:hypothetical protein